MKSMCCPIASNGITDKGLDSIVKFLLLPSAPPMSQLPTIQELILSSNDVSLAGATPHLLSTALSHRCSSLISLSLTSNSRIAEDSKHLANFFKHLEPTSLVQLQLNTCSLEPSDARTIAKWLSDPAKGGRLAHLELNANALGTDIFGTNRLAKVVYAGLNTSLLRLELAANDRILPALDEDGEPTGAQVNVSVPDSLISEASGATARKKATWEEATVSEHQVILGDELPFNELKPILADALARNHILRESTRRTAIGLLPVARILLHAKARISTAEDIKSQIYSVSETFEVASIRPNGKPSNYTYTQKSSSSVARPPMASPPILKLPPELLIHLLRVYSTLEPIPLPPHPGQAASHVPILRGRTPVFASSLSESQFNRVISLAQDRSTLAGMTQRYHSATPNGNTSTPRRDSRDNGRISLHSPFAFLGVVGCLEYERRKA